MLKTNTLLKSALELMVLYTAFSYLFVYSVFKNGLAGVLCSFAFFALMLVVFFAQGRKLIYQKLDIKRLIMLFFTLYMTVHNLIVGNFSNAVCYVGLNFLVIIFSASENAEKYIPLRLMLGVYLFFLFGVFFQLLFPGAYSSIMKRLLLGDEYSKVIAWWTRGYFAGFTHQIGTTGLFISYAIPLVIYSRNKKTLKWILAIAAYIGIIMTGKRMFLLIAVSVPVAVMLCSEKNISKKIRKLMIVALVLLLCVFAIYQFPEQVLSVGGGVKRIAKTVLGMDVDVSSGRTVLWEKAMDIFRSYPIFGAGIGGYEALSGYGTEAHNAFMQLLAETGILGTVLFTGMLVCNAAATVRKLRDNNTPDLKISLYYQMLFIMYSMTGNTVTNIGDVAIYTIMLAPMLSEKAQEAPTLSVNSGGNNA